MLSWENTDIGWMTLEAAVEQAREKPGAYAIRCVDGKPAKIIGRAFREDPTGILCFGEGNLEKRLQPFQKGSASHAEGDRYRKLKYSAKGYPRGCLEVKWVKCKTKKAAKEQQDKWLKEYESEFGELPPLNHQGG